MSYTAAMFKRRPHDSRIEAGLRRWLLAQSEEQRMGFVKELWQINYPFALVLAQSMQLSRAHIEELLRHWLRSGAHNAASQLIARMEPMLGERKFWRIVSEEPLSPGMRDFISYHSKGRLDAIQSKATNDK
jgi:hypothetical protein